jgi:hypothetical protein
VLAILLQALNLGGCGIYLEQISFFLFFFFWVVLGFELRASHLLGRLSATSYSVSPFLWWVSAETIGFKLAQQKIFSFFPVTLGFEFRASYLLDRCSYCLSYSPALCWVFSRQGLITYLLGLASNLDPPDLCLLIS